MPKTGGMFTRTFLLSNLKNMQSISGWHTPARMMDKKYKDLTKFGNIRNPLSWYVSFYFHHLQKSPIMIRRHKERGTVPSPTAFAKYFDPKNTGDFNVFINNIFLDSYLDSNVKFKFIKEYIPYMKYMKKLDVGFYTIMYLNIYFKDFYKIMNNEIDIFKNHDQLLTVKHMLKMESLNKSLAAFLKKNNYSPSIINKLKSEKKINVMKKQSWRNYYSKELIKKIVYKDRLIFDLYYKGFKA